MSKEEEETTYSNDSHMDLLCTSEEECAMVAQDRANSEDLDDSIVTFGQQSSGKESFEKIHDKNIFNKKVVQKKKCHTTIQEKQQMNLNVLQNIQEKRFFVENRACGTKKMTKKTPFGGEPSEKHQSKI